MSSPPLEALRSLLTLRYYRCRTDEETLPFKEWTYLQPHPISLDNALTRLNKLVDLKSSNAPKLNCVALASVTDYVCKRSEAS